MNGGFIINNKFTNFLGNLKSNKIALGSTLGAVGSVVAAVPTFAADSTGMTFTITTEMLTPVTSAISSGLNVLVPIGLGVMAAMIGISLIPRVIYKFL